jgi:hypothetical protein
MRTLADMEKELKHLRRRVNELEGVAREQAQVAELVSNDADRNHPGIVPVTPSSTAPSR